ncbi:MAG: hypothetical protein ACI4KD_02825 [Oscillospiraceae bacterium]
MNDITLKLTDINGGTAEIKKCLSMKVEKEVYTPYSVFSGTFYSDERASDIADIELYIDGKLIHKGFADSADTVFSKDGNMLSLVSRGYSSLLSQSELEDGIFSKPSLNTIFLRVRSPHITCEDSSATVNYIYLNPHSTIWDACVAVCLKKHKKYPYIAAPNVLRYTIPENALSTEPQKIISKGSCLNLKNAISDVYMRGLPEGEEDTDVGYTLHQRDEEIRALGIIRERYYPYDKAWAFDDRLGLETRINFSMRGSRADFVRYYGYSGEDLNDSVIFDGKSGNISRMLISGGKNGVLTTLWRYYDRYNNV